MTAATRQRDSEDRDRAGEEESPTVACCETRPGRVVFTEKDNADAWIATDLAVDVSR